ncbi:MAG: peptidoglycan-associated lipoprotein Pal [Bdellovibrionaceae bacterium]|nr:peptidoglycan-associated lipoprotein Pal [Pseudobdellovibrionaceae bacterium]
MFQKLAFALVAVALVAGCKSKQKSTDIESTPITSATSDTAVESTPMSFDATGSDSGKIPGLETVHFEYDKSNISAENKRILQGNGDWIKKNTTYKVQIEGHCDNRGTIEYNLALGERRANAVKAYLVSLGVPAARVSVISYGKEKPVEQGDSEAAYVKNRRANFVPVQQ